MYMRVTMNRYSWFGKMDACRRPTLQLRARFLDADDHFKPTASTAQPPQPLDDDRQTLLS
jgi:hypothetical protein